MLRDGAAVADLVVDGALERPGPLRLPPPYPARHRWMDAVQLQALAAGRVDGPRFFTDLFATLPAEQVLRFLDGTSTVAEEVGIMRASPTWAMTRTAGDDAVAVVGKVHGAHYVLVVPNALLVARQRVPQPGREVRRARDTQHARVVELARPHRALLHSR